MGLKGSAVITLTDINTGLVETIKEDNLVTNALNQIFNNQFSRYIDVYSSDYMYKNYLGGIMLFNNTQIESKSNVNDVHGPDEITGYASYTQKGSTIDPKRGNMNLTETTSIPNGLKIVFDFMASECNGTISSISLTHESSGIGKRGGVIHQADIGHHPDNSLLDRATGNIYGLTISGAILDINIYQNKVGGGVSLKPPIQGGGGYTKLHTITLDVSPRSVYMDKIVDNNLYLAVITYVAANQYKTSYIKVSLSDGIYTSQHTTFETYNNEILYYDGYWYAISKDQLSLCKVNSITGEKTLTKLPSICNTLYRTLVPTLIFLNCGTYFVYNTVTGVFTSVSSYLGNINYNTWYSSDDIFSSSTYSGDICYISWRANYLATINNLATPIVKTSDKTMKIVYTLTE